MNIVNMKRCLKLIIPLFLFIFVTFNEGHAVPSASQAYLECYNYYCPKILGENLPDDENSYENTCHSECDKAHGIGVYGKDMAAIDLDKYVIWPGFGTFWELDLFQALSRQANMHILKEHTDIETKKMCKVSNLEELKYKMETIAAQKEFCEDYTISGSGSCFGFSCGESSNSWTRCATWAYDIMCATGIDEYNKKGALIAKYKFEKNGEIKKQVYNKQKKEWGVTKYISGSTVDGKTEWEKDGWTSESTGWCDQPDSRCVVKKQIEIASDIIITEPFIIPDQETTNWSWPFELELSSKGGKHTLSGDFPVVSLAEQHRVILSGINIKLKDGKIDGYKMSSGNNSVGVYGRILPIDSMLEEANISLEPELDGTKDAITIEKLEGGTAATCESMGVSSPCYRIRFSPSGSSCYQPNWAGFYRNNKFQFAVCEGSMYGSPLYQCGSGSILSSKESCLSDNVKWTSLVYVPASLIEADKEYKVMFNELNDSGSVMKSFSPATHEYEKFIVKPDIKFAKFKGPGCPDSQVRDSTGNCISEEACKEELKGIVTLNIKWGKEKRCTLCKQDAITINDSCVLEEEYNNCLALNRVWGAGSCGSCKPGLTDISGVCINTVVEKAACEAKPATHGKWIYSSTSNACSFACDSGFIKDSEGVCELKCDGNGLVPNSGETACTCDTANHWTPYSGGGCMCEEGYSLEGNACVSTTPPGPDTCGSDSECNDDEVCKDGQCQNEEPQPFKGECKSNGDCGTGMICLSSNNKCVCDTDNHWFINDAKDGCEHHEDEAVEAMCKLNDGQYLDDRCVYNPDEITCLKSDGKWKEKACWHDPDGDGEWTPDTDLPENNSNRSGCGCTMGNASLPESLGSVLPYLLLLSYVSLRVRRAKQSPASN